MFDTIHRKQTVKVVTVRMDEAIHAALKKLRFTKEAPSVNKVAIWSLLDQILAHEEAFVALMQNYGFESPDELREYLSAIYDYQKVEDDSVAPSPTLDMVSSTPLEEQGNARIA